LREAHPINYKLALLLYYNTKLSPILN